MRLLARINKIEDVIGSPHTRHVVFVAPREDSPEAIDAAIKAMASELDIPVESIDKAWLFFDNELREHQINPCVDSRRLSDKGFMKQILDDMDGKSTGLPNHRRT